MEATDHAPNIDQPEIATTSAAVETSRSGYSTKLKRWCAVIFATALSVIVLMEIFPKTPKIQHLPEREERIIHPLDIDLYPTSTVYIEVEKRFKYGASSCTGSILSSGIILTAAHCFISREGQMDFVPKESSLSRLQAVTVYAGLKEKNIDSYYHRKWKKSPHEQKILLRDELKGNKIKNVLKLSPFWFRSLSDKRKLQLEHGDIAVIILPPNKHINMKLTQTKPINIFAPGYKYDIPAASKQTEWRMKSRNATVVGYGKIYPNNRVIKGLGTHHFKILTKSSCKDHMRSIGWYNDLDLMDVQHIFCAKGMKLPNLKQTQVCSGDSGGPIFTDVSLITLQDKTLLYQLTKKMQIGITVWVDSKCVDNFNGFMSLSPYLDWIKGIVSAAQWQDIDARIFPNQTQIELFETYKNLILPWRHSQN